MPVITKINGISTNNISKINGIAISSIAKWNGLDVSSVPANSIDYEASSSQYLSMTNANFGAYDRAKFGVHVWFKRESTGTTQYIANKGNAGANAEWWILFQSNNKIDIRTFTSGGTLNGQLVTTATYTDTTSFHQLYFTFDSANATPADRMRLWIDQTEVTAFDTDTNPTVSAQSATDPMGWGGNSAVTGNTFDGLQYQGAIFSGTLPNIGDLHSAGNPVSLNGITGLYSYLDVAGGDVTNDAVLATAWTNNNSAIASATVP